MVTGRHEDEQEVIQYSELPDLPTRSQTSRQRYLAQGRAVVAADEALLRERAQTRQRGRKVVPTESQSRNTSRQGRTP